MAEFNLSVGMTKEQVLTLAQKLNNPAKIKVVNFFNNDADGKISHDIRYMWNLKRNDINELTYRTERHKTQKTNSWLTYKTERDSQTENEPAVVRGKA